MTLTKRQAEVYGFIVDSLTQNQCTPTVREIGSAFGINSPNGMICHLVALENKGLIRRVPGGGSRNIRLENVKIIVRDKGD